MNPSTPSSGYLLAVDPGLRCCGVALFRDGVLVRAGAVRGPAKGRGPAVWSALAAGVESWIWQRESVGGPPRPQVLVVETMRIDARSVAEDVLEVQAVAACIVGRLWGWTPDEAPAHKWKGQTPRDVMGRRVEKHVQDEGLWSAIEVPSVKDHLNDVMHAVGIGWWYLDGGRA